MCTGWSDEEEPHFLIRPGFCPHEGKMFIRLCSHFRYGWRGSISTYSYYCTLYSIRLTTRVEPKLNYRRRNFKKFRFTIKQLVLPKSLQDTRLKTIFSRALQSDYPDWDYFYNKMCSKFFISKIILKCATPFWGKKRNMKLFRKLEEQEADRSKASKTGL